MFVYVTRQGGAKWDDRYFVIQLKVFPIFSNFGWDTRKASMFGQMEWSQRQRGEYPVVDVATKASPLHTTGYTSLIVTNTENCGWDLSQWLISD
ncbi:hypothetical protein KIN20_028338 [Parelaphostrongylus tenuis]|uniref:Uncharacterized protein n=1 Tax=Parelaphostrongylus tenuis TaxID=148309 RepID=A0AAD5WEM7_PARTN|nr:hypothetical protein KIN20_028338 [Parelaphostrongylus tenuis]